MNKTLWISVSIIFLLFLSSCSSEPVFKGIPITGAWRVIEVLSDPGDGSGVFIQKQSDKTLTLDVDGNFKSMGSFCEFGFQGGENVKSTYKLELNDSMLLLQRCDEAIQFSLSADNNELILRYVCNEGCALKLRRQ